MAFGSETPSAICPRPLLRRHPAHPTPPVRSIGLFFRPMAYLILAVIVLLVIGVIALAVLARDYWRWFHVTAACTLATLAALFVIPTAGVLKARQNWNQVYETQSARLVQEEVKLRELKFGDASDPSVGPGILDLTQSLTRASLEAGRRWSGLQKTAAGNNAVTLGRVADVTDVPAQPNLPAGEDGEAVEVPPLAPVGLVVYAFGEAIDPQTQISVPRIYLGEYEITASTPDSLTLAPTKPLTPPQARGVDGSNQWTLYELLPLDSHTTFLAPGSGGNDDNILGRIDEAAVRATLEGQVSPRTLESYLQDGRRARPDDPPLTRWVKVEVVKPLSIDVDAPGAASAVIEGGFYDGTGRSLDSRLKRDAEGNVSFKAGDTLLMTRQSAGEYLDDGRVKLLDEFYLRPLNDYRFILRRIQIELQEANSRLEELEFERKTLEEAIEKTNGLIVVQQDRKNKLEQDLAQFTDERRALADHAETLQTRRKELRQTVARLHRSNLEMERKLTAIHSRIAGGR